MPRTRLSRGVSPRPRPCRNRTDMHRPPARHRSRGRHAGSAAALRWTKAPHLLDVEVGKGAPVFLRESGAEGRKGGRNAEHRLCGGRLRLGPAGQNQQARGQKEHGRDRLHADDRLMRPGFRGLRGGMEPVIGRDDVVTAFSRCRNAGSRMGRRATAGGAVSTRYNLRRFLCCIRSRKPPPSSTLANVSHWVAGGPERTGPADAKERLHMKFERRSGGQSRSGLLRWARWSRAVSPPRPFRRRVLRAMVRSPTPRTSRRSCSAAARTATGRTASAPMALTHVRRGAAVGARHQAAHRHRPARRRHAAVVHGEEHRHPEVQGRSVVERRRGREGREVGRQRCAARQPGRHAAAEAVVRRQRVGASARPDLIVKRQDIMVKGERPRLVGRDSKPCRSGLTEDRYVAAVEIKEVNDARAHAGTVATRWAAVRLAPHDLPHAGRPGHAGRQR